MPHFSNHMSYQQIADALHHVQLESRLLSSSEWECLSKSLENPLTLKLLELHPLPKTSQKVISETREQIIAREPQREHNEADNNVHSAIYGGEREKTAAYLKKTYPPAQSADWMERLSALVCDAIKANTEVQNALTNAEKSRYHERENDRARLQEEARALNQTAAPSALPPEVSVAPLDVIQNDFINYLSDLETLKRQESTYAWDILQSLIQWYESRKTAEQKQDALVSLIIALDDARTAYHTQHRKHITGTDYTCQRGLEERLLDRHAYLRPLEVKGAATPIEQTLHALTEPFLSRDSVLEGCRSTFSAELYRMYCEVAGYHIIKPQLIEIYALVEDIQHSDAQLEEQYLSSLETSSPLSERMKDYHRNQFRSLLSCIRHKSVLASAKTTPALEFLQDLSLITIISHQPEDTLQQVGPEKTEAEIFNEMLERYPCFLGAAHLKLVLTLHNLYGRFDGDFETYATFATMKAVAESGIIPDSIRAIDSDSLIAFYSQHLSSLEFHFYDFYPVAHEDQDQLTERLTQNLHQWPCSEEVLLEWLQEPKISLEYSQKLAVLAAKTGYTHALRMLLNPPYLVSPNYECPEEGETLLMLAAENGYTEVVKVLLKALEKAFFRNAVCINRANQYGNTPLIYATYYGHTQIVQALIDGGANLNLADQKGGTALQLAAFKGHPEIVQALIDGGANLNLADQKGRTALMAAAQTGRTQIVQVLIHASANLNLISQNGHTALMLAAFKDHRQIVQALIDGGANINLADQKGITALMLAAQNGHTEIVQVLIHASANLNLTDQKGRTALIHATKKGHTQTMQALVNAGANVNYADQDGFTALMIAAEKGHTQTVQALVDAGANVNYADQDGFTALMVAAQDDHTEIVQALIDGGADVNHTNQNRGTALMLAAQADHTEIVQALVDAGANVNYADQDGFTARMIAAQNGHTEIVNTLIDLDAPAPFSSEVVKNLPLSPRSQLKNAILEDDRQKVLHLLQQNPKIGNTYYSEVQNSALMYALQQGRMEIVADLMQGKMAPYHVQDAIMYAIEHPIMHQAIPFLAQEHIVNMIIRQKYPIIALATKYRCLGALEIFIEAGADRHQTDPNGYTAHQYATEQGDHHLYELLQKSKDPLTNDLNIQRQREENAVTYCQTSILFSPARVMSRKTDSPNPS